MMARSENNLPAAAHDLQMIRPLEAERDAIVTDAAPAHLNADKIRQLNKLRALGPELSTVLVGEVFYRSFNNRKP